MSTTQSSKERHDGLTEEQVEERKRLGLAPDAPEALVEAARSELGKDDPEGPKKEATVLDWLLGPTEPLEFDCVAHVDTADGRQDLTFHFRQVDDTRLDELEKEHSEQTLMGREVDRLMLNAAIVAEATLYLEDADGNQVNPKSEKFRGPIGTVADPMRARFKFQPGILGAVAEEIRMAAGLSTDRVEGAERAKGKLPGEPRQAGEQSIATAVGNS
jgi:hypothetical protein